MFCTDGDNFELLSSPLSFIAYKENTSHRHQNVYSLYSKRYGKEYEDSDKENINEVYVGQIVSTLAGIDAFVNGYWYRTTYPCNENKDHVCIKPFIRWLYDVVLVKLT